MDTTGWNLTPADIRHCHYDGHDVLQNISKDEEQRCSRIAIATSAFAKLPGAPPQVLGGKPQVRPVSAESRIPAPTRITRTRRAGPDTRAEMHPKSSGRCAACLSAIVCCCRKFVCVPVGKVLISELMSHYGVDAVMCSLSGKSYSHIIAMVPDAANVTAASISRTIVDGACMHARAQSSSSLHRTCAGRLRLPDQDWAACVPEFLPAHAPAPASAPPSRNPEY